MRKMGIILVTMIVLLLSACAGGRTQGDLATASDQTDIQKRAQNHMNLAIGYYQQGQWSSALDDIKKAIQLDSNMADAYGVRALIYMEMGEVNLAEESFLQSLSIAPENPDSNNNYGWFLCQNGRAAQSFAYFETAGKSRNYQSPAKAYNNAAKCSMKLKKNDEAVGYFLKGFQTDPRNSDSNANLAKIYLDRRDYERARFYIARVAQDAELSAETLWLAIRVQHKLGDRDAETGLISQLRKRYPNSQEYSAFRRGAFDD
jgi:type IV pilus assembly protein PilF